MRGQTIKWKSGLLLSGDRKNNMPKNNMGIKLLLILIWLKINLWGCKWENKWE